MILMFLFNFQKLVCKVDQLVKRRAKSGLIKVKVDWEGAKEFVAQHLDKEIKVRKFTCTKNEIFYQYLVWEAQKMNHFHIKRVLFRICRWWCHKSVGSSRCCCTRWGCCSARRGRGRRSYVIRICTSIQKGPFSLRSSISRSLAPHLRGGAKGCKGRPLLLI